MRAEQDLFVHQGAPYFPAKNCAGSGAQTQKELRIFTRLRTTTASHSRPAPQTESTADGEANQGSLGLARVALGDEKDIALGKLSKFPFHQESQRRTREFDHLAFDPPAVLIRNLRGLHVDRLIGFQSPLQFGK